MRAQRGQEFFQVASLFDRQTEPVALLARLHHSLRKWGRLARAPPPPHLVRPSNRAGGAPGRAASQPEKVGAVGTGPLPAASCSTVIQSRWRSWLGCITACERGDGWHRHPHRCILFDRQTEPVASWSGCITTRESGDAWAPAPSPPHVVRPSNRAGGLLARLHHSRRKWGRLGTGTLTAASCSTVKQSRWHSWPGLHHSLRK